MPTSLAPRGVFGVIVPSTNTVVEDEYNRLRPPGVSFHAGRILIRDGALDSDAAFEAFLVDLRTQIAAAVDSVMTVKPDSLIMGMSAETFWGGAAGSAAFEAWMGELSGGMAVATGAAACAAALGCFGAKRVGIITPYQPIGDAQVRDFFVELGYQVASVVGLRCSSATAIAEVTEEDVRQAFLAVDGPDVDALVQAGTNLAAVDVAAKLEVELGKPVIAINAATLWHALRRSGIPDRVVGSGRLLEEF
jgi:maleate isomerase